MAISSKRWYFFLCLISLISITGLLLFEGNYITESNSGRHLLQGSGTGGASCTEDATCGGTLQGTCIAGQCQCNNRFSGSTCTTARKLKLEAFCYSFVLGGWGADRFYLGYTGIGVLKLIIGIIPLVLSCLTGTMCKEKTGCMKNVGNLVMFLSVVGVILFWLYDWISILNNNLPDADGNQLLNNLN